MEIIVYKSLQYNEIEAEFKSIKKLIEYAEKNKTMADQVSINGLVILGWDEI